MSVNSKIVFVPALVAILVAKEKEKGSPLTQDEVEKYRDISTCISVDSAVDIEKSRNYEDIDPENVWDNWLDFKKE